MRSIEWWHCRWPWVTPNPYVIAMTLSVLEGRFPTGSLRTVSAAFCCSAEVSTPWCQSVYSLVPKWLGAEVSWSWTVRTLRHRCRWCRSVFWSLRHWCLSVLSPKCPVTGLIGVSVLPAYLSRCVNAVLCVSCERQTLMYIHSLVFWWLIQLFNKAVKVMTHSPSPGSFQYQTSRNVAKEGLCAMVCHRSTSSVNELTTMQHNTVTLSHYVSVHSQDHVGQC